MRLVRCPKYLPKCSFRISVQRISYGYTRKFITINFILGKYYELTKVLQKHRLWNSIGYKLL